MWWMLSVPFWQRYTCMICTQTICSTLMLEDYGWCLDFNVWSTSSGKTTLQSAISDKNITSRNVPSLKKTLLETQPQEISVDEWCEPFLHNKSTMQLLLQVHHIHKFPSQAMYTVDKSNRHALWGECHVIWWKNLAVIQAWMNLKQEWRCCISISCVMNCTFFVFHLANSMFLWHSVIYTEN